MSRNSLSRPISSFFYKKRRPKKMKNTVLQVSGVPNSLLFGVLVFPCFSVYTISFLSHAQELLSYQTAYNEISRNILSRSISSFFFLVSEKCRLASLLRAQGLGAVKGRIENLLTFDIFRIGETSQCRPQVYNCPHWSVASPSPFFSLLQRGDARAHATKMCGHRRVCADAVLLDVQACE
jgi:hypothetical protein